MRQEHNQAHRTPPVPHSGSLCASRYRVPKPRFCAPETVRGLRGKKRIRSPIGQSRAVNLQLVLTVGARFFINALQVGLPYAVSALCSLRVSRLGGAASPSASFVAGRTIFASIVVAQARMERPALYRCIVKFSVCRQLNIPRRQNSPYSSNVAHTNKRPPAAHISRTTPHEMSRVLADSPCCAFASRRGGCDMCVCQVQE